MRVMQWCRILLSMPDAKLIGTDNPGDWFYFDAEPQIAMDANGNALVVWQQIDGTTSSGIWWNRYTAGAGWGAAEPLVANRAGEPQITMDTNGTALAVWVQGDGTSVNVWSNRYVAGAGWGTAVPIWTGTARNPQIAVDAQGNALATWEQADGAHIWSSRYAAGGGWDTPASIDIGSVVNAIGPQIACDMNGNALVVWQQMDGTRYNIWSNRYTVGGGWGTPAAIETDNAGDATLPQIASDANGNALAVWQQSDGVHTNIWSNRFESGNAAAVH
jgi:hypothetical protein